jgi:hypothetical protein
MFHEKLVEQVSNAAKLERLEFWQKTKNTLKMLVPGSVLTEMF